MGIFDILSKTLSMPGAGEALPGRAEPMEALAG